MGRKKPLKRVIGAAMLKKVASTFFNGSLLSPIILSRCNALLAIIIRCGGIKMEPGYALISSMLF